MNVTICPLCHSPYTGDRCDNPGCEASGNVPQEILDRRKREAEERAERDRIWRIRERLSQR